ncbi:MAG: ATPase domain-containing protein [Nitrososphaerota archaeon]
MDGLRLHKRLELVKNLILEDYPNATFLHIGPRGCGKSLFLKHILYERLKQGFRCVNLCVKSRPIDFLWLMRKRNMDAETYLKSGDLILIDYHTAKLGHPTMEALDNVLQLTTLDLTELSVMLDMLRLKPVEFFYVDSLLDIFIDFGYKNAMKFIDTLITRIKDTCVGAFALDKGILGDRIENYLRSIVDGVAEYMIVDTPEGIERYIRMAHFDFANVDTRWHKLVIGQYDIKIE